MQELLEYAASSQDEVCGLIIDGERLFRCRNIHPDPHNQFRIADDDWLAAEEAGEVTAVFHSHPMNLPTLSSSDRRAQIASDLPWILACNGVLRTFLPVPHLLGRRFEHGVTDCYTLFRDAYHLCGIDLPDFVRKNGWWLRGENLYLKNLPRFGFSQVCPSEALPGDVIIRQPFPGADPCHAMVLLDDNLVLHHDCAGHLSRRESMRPAFVKQMHSIWRHEQCSSLNLQGIYADISAKSN
ncbi:C40 family peptidase [Citrobacter freundii]|uniref:C40 family peptidase n=1 Tax=Citrobacter freundii TaxID=546 RepID=UPI0008FD8701|nr:C40 family peptidase [Citrobacter freundii]MDH0770423.1 C40 family peptidase [Citrobacter freundii]MDH1001313.1 C40 family peptidase [Citrobacter freundii]MDH1811145.1 C40 family peptidase [Citrobacter freundii]MDH1963735.1 C40 family peptidase [Citrobacter freundii]MDT7338287.1 C40 family peptidase [Citrobacter freundii]